MWQHISELISVRIGSHTLKTTAVAPMLRTANQYSNKRWCCNDQVSLGPARRTRSACKFALKQLRSTQSDHVESHLTDGNPRTCRRPAQTHFDVSVWAWEKLADKKWGVIGKSGAHPYCMNLSDPTWGMSREASEASEVPHDTGCGNGAVPIAATHTAAAGPFLRRPQASSGAVCRARTSPTRWRRRRHGPPQCRQTRRVSKTA